MSADFASALNGMKVQQSFDADVAKRVGKVEGKANEAIQSFASLVEEINNLQKDSLGTTKKEEVNQLANDMNNSQVMLTRMLTANLEALHGIVQEGHETQVDSTTV